MPAKDAWSAAFCCGTSSIIRFGPLQAIDGFPTDSVTEDYLLTLRMKESGYTTAYLNEPLTCGLAPEGLKEYVTQRSRWCLGFMHIARGRSGPFSTTSPLAFIDRLSLFEAFLNWTAVYATRGIGLLIPIISLIFDIHPFNAPLQDVATYFLPYFLWHGLAMHWLSSGRLMPILSDVSQIIMIPQILKAVVVGLGRPQGHKFQVTAKGGDRRRRFVEWSLMRPFATLIGLSIYAIVYSFYINERAELTAYAAPALAWIWYNLLILTTICFVCVEQPRRRGAERFHSGEIASVRAMNVGRTVQIADFSITGARILGEPPDVAGRKIVLEFSDCSVEAKIVRVAADSFAVEFDASLMTRIAMIRHFYAGNYIKPLSQIDVLKVGTAVMRRVLN
jgi:cellulose synthase (UDP-forming)